MKPYLTGKNLIRLMRKHRVTIRELSDRMGITMKRIRQVRLSGLFCPHTARDWIQAVTGQDPGWLGETYNPEESSATTLGV